MLTVLGKTAAASTFLLLLWVSLAASETDVAETRQEAMVAQYQDETGQKVWTAEGKTVFRFLENWRLGVKALGEWVKPGPGRENDTAAVGGGHVHGARISSTGSASSTSASSPVSVDAVSGASSRVSTNSDGHGRVETALTLRRDLESERPAYLGSNLRYSGETDFQSLAMGLNGGVEFFDRNTALAGNVGGGLDFADPEQPPPGERSHWPTSTTRLNAGMQFGQLLTARSRLGLSYAFTALLGPQENPYRRALVHTTLFPERLPETRFRHTLGAELGLYLGAGIAFYHRDGLYFDSWGVQAFIPETSLPMEIGSRWLLTPRHRWYSQSPARFYQSTYHSLDDEWLSGDPRLSRIEGNDFGLDLEYALGPSDGASSLSFSGTYSDLSDRMSGARSRSATFSISFRRPE